MTDGPLVLSVAETAVVLGTSEDMVQKLIRERRIPFVDLGPKTRVIPIDAFRAWLNAEAERSLTQQ